MVDHLSKNPSKSRILIVEDDKSIRETLREALVAEGNAVSAFTAIGAIRPNAAGAINKLLNNFIVSSHRIKVKLDMRSKMKFVGCTFRPD